MSVWSEMKVFIDESLFNIEQLYQLKNGAEKDLPFYLYANPNLTAGEMAEYRTFLETHVFQKRHPDQRCVVTEFGPAQVDFGFKSELNYLTHPNRVCYIPDNWDFRWSGPGYTSHDFLALCNGDKDKADMVFSMCKGQFPKDILAAWDREADLDLIAVKQKKIEALQQDISAIQFMSRPEHNKSSLSEQIRAADLKKATNTQTAPDQRQGRGRGGQHL